jgi:starch-binding outer membrane protein, SusD/RagB family
MTETHVFTLTEDDPSWTCPIPQEVIEFNTGMKNNGNLYRDYVAVEPIEK